MSARVAVITTVHPPDDPRIRIRTVGVLARTLDVVYATRAPGPVRQDDHEWVSLRGNRIVRIAGALRVAFRPDVAVLSLHDPELLPVGFLARLLGRRRVVFDLHENLPAQILDKEWLWRWARTPASTLAALALHLAERLFIITLAEPGYANLFKRQQVVLPNYPDVDALPYAGRDQRLIVYLGDVQIARGALVALDAVASMEAPLPLHFIGRCPPNLAADLKERATARGLTLHLHGYLPHERAMEIVSGATVGLSPLLDLPNYRHSLPTKVLEYLAVGIPVAASDLPGTREQLEGLDGVWLLPPGDSRNWGHALATAAGNPSFRRAAREQTDEVRRRFRWPAAEVTALYSELVAARRLRARAPHWRRADRSRPAPRRRRWSDRGSP